MNDIPPSETPVSPATESADSREQTVYGRKACWAVFTHRPQDILRVFHTKARRQELTALLKWAAAARIPYRELDEDGMRRVCSATHHEGVAMAVRPRTFEAMDAAGPGPGALWMALDRVENPYNQGAILRTCAFFGIEAVLMGGVQADAKVNGAALRASEGGAETLRLVACPDLAGVLREMALRGVDVVGLESDSSIALGDRAVQRPAVLVAGHEQEGLSPAVRAACSWVCAIPGQGSVSSLNVSVSVGVALAALIGVRGGPDSAQRVRSGGPRPSGSRAVQGEPSRGSANRGGKPHRHAPAAPPRGNSRRPPKRRS